MNKQKLNRRVSKAKKVNNFANRGMSFEASIEKTNAYYKSNKVCMVRKIPTPIRPVKFDDKGKIVEAFYEERSALDFNGVYNGRHIDFDTKETRNKTSLPISIIRAHQLRYAKDIDSCGGLSFFLIRFKEHDEVYILTLDKMDEYFVSNPDKKSIPYSYFKTELKDFFVLRELKFNFIVYDYIKVLVKNNYL